MIIIARKKWQQRAGNLFRKFGTTRSLILMYHRIAEPGIDPWGLAVTPKHFAEQVTILKKHTQLMSLRELTEMHRAGKCPDQAVALTFDDGYADNLYRAKPILEQYQVPATVFIATGYTEKQREFWWDELQNICFQPGKLPQTLSLQINGKTEQWDVGEAVNAIPAEPLHYPTRAWEAPSGTRMHFYYTVWGKLRSLTDLDRENALDAMAAWSDYQPMLRLSHRPMTPAELIDLESSGWIETGAHTVNHVALSAHSSPEQRKEIVGSKVYLEQLLQHPVTTFSYPFGMCNRATVSLVKKMGFTSACTTVEVPVWKRSDPYRLPRFGALDWDSAAFEQKILNWL